jgi:hypothetical protein
VATISLRWLKDKIKGTLVDLTFGAENFEAIVIDPNGLGKNQPSVGLV